MDNKNKTFYKAKETKNDEFFTLLPNIEKEVINYLDFFKGKKVLCNCNDNKDSAFFEYFSINFDKIGLEELVCISYKEKDKHGVKYTLGKDGVLKEEILKGTGDFASSEGLEELDKCDVVVTNPPFSLFRKFLALLIRKEKKFLIIGNMNAINYMGPLIRDRKIWWGCSTTSSARNMWFRCSDDYNPNYTEQNYKEENGNKYREMQSIEWYTNIDVPEKHQPLILTTKYNPVDNPQYDNYKAIECSKVKKIPMDYDGVIGVPITFMEKWCPEQFRIIGITYTKDKSEEMESLRTDLKHRHVPYLNGKEKYVRILIQKIK